MADVKTRNWLFVFYPESCPEDWADVIDSWCCTCYVSPLHDADVKADGTYKKPHYHGILCFDNTKSYGQALSLVAGLGCATCKPCNSIVNSMRYLCHLDNPGKARYEVSEIKTFGHADLSCIYEKSSRERIQDLEDIICLVKQFNITEFSECCELLMCHYPDLFATCVKNHSFVKSYIQSLYLSRKAKFDVW